MRQVRTISLTIARNLGYSTNPSLPFLTHTDIRPLEVVVDRALCLNTVVACACGFSRARACEWLHREKLEYALTTHEESFLKSAYGADVQFQIRVEGLWALAYVLSIVDVLDFGSYCDARLVTLMPDLKRNASASTFRRIATFRAGDQILQALDTAYCLHWAIRDAELRGDTPPGHVEPYVVIERRRALEWCLSEDDWEEVNMDT